MDCIAGEPAGSAIAAVYRLYSPDIYREKSGAISDTTTILYIESLLFLTVMNSSIKYVIELLR